MSNSPNLKTPTVVVPANAGVTVNSVGNFVMSLSSTASPGEIKISLGESGNQLKFDQGDKHRGGPGESFDFVTLINTSGTDRTVVLSMGNGDTDTASQVTVSGNVSVINATGQNLATLEAKSQNISDAADVAVLTAASAQIVAASATRRGIIISNLQVNGTVVRVGGANVGAARGVEIGIGGSAYLETTAAVYVYNPSAATINIGYEEIKD